MQPVNPYAAGTTTSEGGSERPPPRWLAVLVSVMTVNLAGAGLFILNRSWRNAVLPAVSLVLTATLALLVVVAPRLVVPTLLGIALLWVVGVVVTFRARAGEFLGWSKTLLLTAGLVFASQATARSVRAFAAEAFQIPSAAMMPTLLIGDHVFVSKATRSPARG